MLRSILLLALAASSWPALAEEPVALGSRRELLVDDFLIDKMAGVELKLHQPEAREAVITCDKPWEGNISAYYTLFQDGALYRMYYRGAHWDEKARKESHPEFTCYAESRDGIRWTKPELGLFEFEGSKANNIVWTGTATGAAPDPNVIKTPESGSTHNFSPFKDTNPGCKAEARYKALAGGKMIVNGKPKTCLHAYQSPDGIHWSKIQEEPVITDGAFDSQNIAYFDDERGEYRAYWRYFSKGYTDERGWRPEGVRAIRTATSKDFLHWSNQADLKYGDAPSEHLYTNAIRAYDRAPHLFIGFPTRFQPAHQQVEPVFMSSRDGVNFKRWPEALIPITAPKDRDGNRSNYMTRGLLQLPGNDKELSVYATEAYYTGPGSRVRRFVFRMDGFVSATAASNGEIVTKPFTFRGRALSVNIVSKGGTRFELQDAEGKALPGLSLDDCSPVSGDHVAAMIEWKGGDLTALNGKPVRLRAVLDQADWYSFVFAGR